METIYDWLSVILFGAIALTYLHRSVTPIARPDPIPAYLPPVIGSAGANWLGNEGFAVPAVVVLLAAAVYYVLVLKPMDDFR